MGLSAAQARLLTITSRKSDCEFQSMRYSHEKIALSRSMSDVSAEYQRALEQTKLVFDYYGSGDQSTPVSYGLFMTPSQANGFLPILTTNAQNRIVLDSRFAAAARAAGIPEEGLSSLPSTTVRNKFLDALGANNIITETQANTYKVIPYSQTIGMGTQDLVVTNMKTVNFNDLLTMLGDYSVTLPSVNNLTEDKCTYGSDHDGCLFTSKSQIRAGGGGTSGMQWSTGGNSVTLNQLYSDNYFLIAMCPENGGTAGNDRYDNTDKIQWYINKLKQPVDSMINTFSDALYGIFGNALDTNIQLAIETAREKTLANVDVCNDPYTPDNELATYYDKVGDNYAYYVDNWDEYDVGGWYNGTARVNENQRNAAEDIYEHVINDVGYVGFHNRAKWNTSGVGISYTNLLKSFLTYFAQEYETATFNGSQYTAAINESGYTTDRHTGTTGLFESASGQWEKKISGSERKLGNSLIDSKFSVDVETAIGINSDEALLSGYWDALLNNLCAYGWTENNNVTNNEYLQEMYKSGRLFISTCTDDGYYYQTSYSTLSSVREITDEEAATKAEAKYNAEKQKINHKEQIIDMKMKNLDTEISSLSSEYETIKGLLSKNIERSFTRYKA